VFLTGEPYRLYNLDVFEYLHESPFGLYGSIPFMTAHKAGLTTGVFWWVLLSRMAHHSGSPQLCLKPLC
jgi:hypothetical protein